MRPPSNGARPCSRAVMLAAQVVTLARPHSPAPPPLASPVPTPHHAGTAGAGLLSRRPIDLGSSVESRVRTAACESAPLLRRGELLGAPTRCRPAWRREGWFKIMLTRIRATGPDRAASPPTMRAIFAHPRYLNAAPARMQGGPRQDTDCRHQSAGRPRGPRTHPARTLRLRRTAGSRPSPMPAHEAAGDAARSAGAQRRVSVAPLRRDARVATRGSGAGSGGGGARRWRKGRRGSRSPRATTGRLTPTNPGAAYPATASIRHRHRRREAWHRSESATGADPGRRRLFVPSSNSSMRTDTPHRPLRSVKRSRRRNSSVLGACLGRRRSAVVASPARAVPNLLTSTRRLTHRRGEAITRVALGRTPGDRDLDLGAQIEMVGVPLVLANPAPTAVVREPWRAQRNTCDSDAGRRPTPSTATRPRNAGTIPGIGYWLVTQKTHTCRSQGRTCSRHVPDF